MDLEVLCRCGASLKKAWTETEEDSPIIVFCTDCYLNHEFRWRSGRPVLTYQYYFPDD